LKNIFNNLSNFNSKDLNENLKFTFDLYLKLDKKDAESSIITFINTFYNSSLFYPSIDSLKENFTQFDFRGKTFDSITQLVSYIKTIYKQLRDQYRIIVAQKYLDPEISFDLRNGYLTELNNLECSLNQSDESVTNFKDINLKESLDKREKRGEGLSTSIKRIDEVTRGISPGKILTVFAPPGSCKTLFAINMCYTNIMKKNNNTLFLTLEIGKEELKMKLVNRNFFNNANKDFVSILDALKGNLTESGKEMFLRYEKDLESKLESELFLMGNEDIKIDSVYAFRSYLENMIEKNNIKTIFVDYIQLFKEFKLKVFETELSFLNTIVGIFRLLAVTKDVTFVILSQCNRDGIKKSKQSKGYFSLDNLSEINALERDSYYIISFYLNEELKASGNVNYQLLKHRDGETISEPTGVAFDPRYFQIGESEFSVSSIPMIDENTNITINSEMDAFMGSPELELF
jgi:replicative DNA helicase